MNTKKGTFGPGAGSAVRGKKREKSERETRGSAFGVFLKKGKRRAGKKRETGAQPLPLSRSGAGTGAGERVLLPAIGIEPFSVFLRALAAFLAGLLFSRADMLFGAYPLGIALLCAAERYAPLVGLGVFAAGLSLGEGGTVYSFTAVFLLTLRLAVSLFSDKRSFVFLPERGERRRVLFREDVRLRAASACLGGFAVGVFQIIAGGYTYYDLFGSFVLTLGCPLGAWLFSLFLRERGLSRLRLLSAAAYSAAALFSLSRLGAFAGTPALVAATALTLLVGRARGMLPGTLAGLLFGLAAFPLHSPALAAAGMVGGALARFSLPVFSAASLVSAVFTVFLVGGGTAFPAVLPELATGTAIAATLLWLRVPDRLLAAEREPDGEPREGGRDRAGEERMRALSRSFTSLSEICYALSERAKKPNAGELRELFDSVCDR
ncbi:MAG: hypothetical protein II192_05000, partial [Clostridia bacterium]|nr:hypothetical protein [Clostridia bacterium]